MMPYKNTKGIVHLVLIIGVVLVGIVGIGYFAVKNGQIKLSTPNDNIAQNNSPTPSVEINTSEWKTYRNEEYGFEISYPPDWYKEEIENNSESQYTFYIKPENPSINRQINLAVRILRNNVAEYTFGVCCKEKDRTIKRIGSNDFYTSDSGILDGMIQWSYETGDDTILARFNLFIGIRDDPPPLPKVEQVKKEFEDFNQILSTFEFIDDEKSGKCTPIFEVESGAELTASQDYSLECYTATTKEDCEKVDVYRKSTNNFGNSDGIPDCEWEAK